MEMFGTVSDNRSKKKRLSTFVPRNSSTSTHAYSRTNTHTQAYCILLLRCVSIVFFTEVVYIPYVSFEMALQHMN